jgi:hypothetical protein
VEIHGGGGFVMAEMHEQKTGDIKPAISTSSESWERYVAMVSAACGGMLWVSSSSVDIGKGSENIVDKLELLCIVSYESLLTFRGRDENISVARNW